MSPVIVVNLAIARQTLMTICFFIFVGGSTVFSLISTKEKVLWGRAHANFCWWRYSWWRWVWWLFFSAIHARVKNSSCFHRTHEVHFSSIPTIVSLHTRDVTTCQSVRYVLEWGQFFSGPRQKKKWRGKSTRLCSLCAPCTYIHQNVYPILNWG